MGPAEITRVEGSFRDPSGFVFSHDGRMFRAIDQAFDVLYREPRTSKAIQQLIDRQLLVKTWPVEDDHLRAIFQDNYSGFRCFLEHEKVPFISYPYEWSFSMLADAAIHTLRVQKELLSVGLSLKDATPYNIQFVQGKPVFIDITSIERPARLDIWFALGQFLRLFYYPLLLACRRGGDFRSYYLGSINGQSLEQVAAALGPMAKYAPSNLLDVGLPLLLERRDSKKTKKGVDSDKPVDMAAAEGNAQTQEFNLARLESKLKKLNKKVTRTHQSVWSDYTSICNYDDQATAKKKSLIAEFLESHKPSSVLDLGCNTGEYSRLATSHGCDVIAADFDPVAIDRLYSAIKPGSENSSRAISPVILDLANPSPAIGYLNVERDSFLSRCPSQCVFALALIHHLLVSENMTLEAISRLFAVTTSQYLVLEFVPTNDSMFERLLRFRKSYFDDLNLDKCLNAFSKDFHLLQKCPIEGTVRTLLFFEKKA